ncbi:prolyl 4-hydroxylase subunit alpha-2-like [Lineus longissimus]|uniref:prolyl 4-hydroxylase subunit alpha-2-like n=1 Tax=Lineus longissimus TaxID=88925 RepID=UPI002B4D6B57
MMEQHQIFSCFILLTCLVSYIPSGQAEIYSALFRLKNAFAEEGKALDSTNEVLKSLAKSTLEEAGVRDFERFVFETTNKHDTGTTQGTEYMEHPVNVYHVIRRMAQDWPKKLKLIFEVEDKSIQKLYQSLSNLTTTANKWPSILDKNGVTLQLIRIQALYLLDIHELATGTLNGTTTDPLALDEVFDVALFAYDRGMFYEAVLWYEGLVEEILKGGKGKVTLSKAARGLASSYFRYENYKKPVEVLEEALKKEPDDKRLQVDLDYYRQKLADKQTDGVEVDKKLEPLDNPNYSHAKKYFAMCRGDIKKPESYRKKLKCKYRRTDIPYRPAKMEIVNLDPLVVMFHDVIYDDEMQLVKRMAKPHMTRSLIRGRTETDGEVSDGRLSDTAWFDDRTRLIARLSRRVQETTGLSTEIHEVATHAENMQVLNYGLGGMYEPHEDYFGSEKNQGTNKYVVGSGDRLATWMFYINEVKVGGATVFPKFEARVPVVKGAAVFWANYFVNGTADARTTHAGCPVVIGSKWVMNKWIRTRAQINRWRCSKRRYARTPAIYL